MITKERLEELIEQGATIYDKYGCEIDLAEKDNFLENIFNIYFKIERGQLYRMNKDLQIVEDQWYLQNLYETKEEAEEYLKYGNVKKTIELVMADWNDVKNATHGYCGSFWEENILYELIIEGGEVYIRTTDYYYSELENQFNRENYEFKKEFNRENYNEARDLFVKLFMGEEE